MVYTFVTRVGGNYNNGVEAGLWYWNCNNTSSNSNGNLGARPLILKWGLDVYASLLFSALSLVSAATMVIVQVILLACGVGIVITLLVIRTATTELDNLYIRSFTHHLP